MQPRCLKSARSPTLRLRPNEVPGGVPQPTQQEIQQYYTAHQSEYSVPEQARSRHILIKVAAGADAKDRCRGQGQGRGHSKQIQAGANFAELAKKYSDDPGSKDSGGELGFAQRGHMVPEFDNAIFTQKIGDIKIVKSQYGYHIVQVEERTPAHTQSLSEVLPTIQATLIRQKSAAAQENYARAADLGGHQERAAEDRRGSSSAIGDDAAGGRAGRDFGAARRLAAAGQGVPVEAGRSGAVRAHRRGICGLPGYGHYAGPRADLCRLEEPCAGRLSQRATARCCCGRRPKELAAKAKAMNDLAKAAKAVGATVKTSDLVGQTGQVPDLGAVGQVAPQLFDMAPEAISGPINGGRTGVVAKMLMKTGAKPR